MAEEKKTPEKQGWFKKLINWFKNLPGRIAKAFKNMVAELRKVTWPSKKKLITSCVMVLVFMLFMGIVIGLLDLGATALVNTMIGNPSTPAVTETVETADEAAEAVEEAVEATETAVEEATEAATEESAAE